ncbi:unnamed protein product [Rhizopus stolonifer]
MLPTCVSKRENRYLRTSVSPFLQSVSMSSFVNKVLGLDIKNSHVIRPEREREFFCFVFFFFVIIIMQNSEPPQFFGVVKSVRTLLTLIKAINIKNTATCYISDEGFTLTVEESRCVKATAYLKRHLFQIYIKQQQEIDMFGLTLNTLIDCLGLMLPHNFQSSDTCDIQYDGPGSRFSLKRYDRVHKKTSACNIIPMQPEEESVDSLLGNTDIHTQKMISKSDWLSDFLGGLDKSCESIAFSFSPHGTPFTFSAIGPGISSETSYPEHSEPFINFECDRDLSFR